MSSPAAGHPDYLRRRRARRRGLEPHGAGAWDGEIELCPDALYLQLTGKTAEDLFPSLHQGELLDLWETAKRSEPLYRVEPLP